MSRLLFRGFRRPRAAVESALGRLERRVLEELWSLGREASVREVQERFDGPVAYTTVMTTVDRLFKKGLLERRRIGRAFVYRARVTREELHSHVARDVIDGLFGPSSDGARPLMSALLDELEALVRERRERERGRR
jgi:predicted transcriptional regulator